MAQQPTELREMVRLKVRRIDLVAAPANRREFLAIKGELDEEMLEESEVQKSMERTTQAQPQGGDVSNPTQVATAQAQPAGQTQPVDKATNLASALRRIYDTLAKHAATWPQEAKQALQELAQIIAGNYAYAYPAPGQKQDQPKGQAQAAVQAQGQAPVPDQPTQKADAAAIQEAITAALRPVQEAIAAQKADLVGRLDGLAAKVADLDQRLTRIEELRGVRKSAVGQQPPASTSGKKSIWGDILGPY